MLGAVGQLQFEVFKHRMEGECRNAEVVASPMGKKTVRWIKPRGLDERRPPQYLAKDRFDLNQSLKRRTEKLRDSCA